MRHYSNLNYCFGKCLVFLIVFIGCFALTTNLNAQNCTAHPNEPMKHTEHCALFELVIENEATHVAVNSGSWFLPATWQGNLVPTDSAAVLINSGVTVVYDDTSTVEILTIRVNGILDFSPSTNTVLHVNTLVVDPEGELNMGTAAAPIQASVSTQIVFPDNGPLDTIWDPFELSKGIISHGQLTTYGAEKSNYVALSTAPIAGTTMLDMASTPIGWQIGDQIILAGTYADWTGDDDDNTRFHDEELTITNISGTNLNFTNNANGQTALLYDHLPPSGHGLEVFLANISRNIRIETENSSVLPASERGHFMMMHNPNSTIYYTGFHGLGRTDKNIDATDPVVDTFGIQISGGENPRGRYGCHLHRTGSSDINSTPVSVIGNVLTDTPGWGFVNHNSHVVMEDNVVYDFVGAAFITEDGNELGAFRQNIAIKGRGDDDPSRNLEVSGRVTNFDLGFNGDGFWMQTANVSYENNIVASAAGSAFILFADDDLIQGTVNLHYIDVANLPDPNIAAPTDTVVVNAAIPMRKMMGLKAYNVANGFSTWMHMRSVDGVGSYVFHPEIAHTTRSIVEDFEFWNLLVSGINFSYTSQVIFRNGLLLGDIANQHANSNWPNDRNENGYANIKAGVIANAAAGDLITFENLTVEGWQFGLMTVKSGRSFYFNPQINYNQSQLLGGQFDNNTENLFPLAHIDENIPNTHVRQFGHFFEISDSTVFNSIAPSNDLPIGSFTTTPRGGLTVSFDALASFDPDPSIANLVGNGIAAYSWDFGDGQTSFGAIRDHTYDCAGTYTVTLTVYDSQGAIGTLSQNILIDYSIYDNLFLNGDFSTNIIEQNYEINNRRHSINDGWKTTSTWEIQNDEAVVANAPGHRVVLMQAVQNDWTHRGIQQFSFDAINNGAGAENNEFEFSIYGINSEFVLRPHDFDAPWAWKNNDTIFSETLLFQEDIGGAAFGWTNYEYDIDFSDGYQFVLVRIDSRFVTGAEFQAVDNISLQTDCSAEVSHTLSGPQSGITSAQQSISSTGIVSSGEEVIYKAGVTICLESGFEVVLGGAFEGRNEGCQ